MPTTQARVTTEFAPKYIAQLCKHFRHKVPAEYDDTTGRVDFQPGQCVLAAEENALLMRCETDDPDNMGRLQFILEEHLKRFAWRENPEITWTPVS